MKRLIARWLRKAATRLDPDSYFDMREISWALRTRLSA